MGFRAVGAEQGRELQHLHRLVDVSRFEVEQSEIQKQLPVIEAKIDRVAILGELLLMLPHQAVGETRDDSARAHCRDGLLSLADGAGWLRDNLPCRGNNRRADRRLPRPELMTHRQPQPRYPASAGRARIRAPGRNPFLGGFSNQWPRAYYSSRVDVLECSRINSPIKSGNRSAATRSHFASKDDKEDVEDVRPVVIAGKMRHNQPGTLRNQIS